MSRLTAIISALVICIIVCLSWAVNHYRDNAIAYKDQRDKATSIIADMQKRQRDVAELDARYTKELADANATAYFHERRSLNNFHRDRVITFEQIAE